MDFLTLLFAISVLILGTSGELKCHWGDNNLTIGQQYFEDTCPPDFYIQPGGSCTIQYLDQRQMKCDSFCQVRTTFSYGLEQPFITLGYIIGPASVPFDDQNQLQVVRGTDAIVDDGSKTDIFNPGSTSGYDGITYGIARGENVNMSTNIADGWCGYLSFLPITRTVCGSRTYGGNCGQSVNTVANYCGTELQLNGSRDSWKTGSSLQGIINFVWTDCETLQPRPDVQEAVYNGSALNETQYKPYADFWRRFKQGVKPLSIDPGYTNCTDSTARGSARSMDCTEAIAEIMATPDRNVTSANNALEPVATIQNIGTCTVQVVYHENWSGKSCAVSYLEVAAAAHMIMNSCVNPSGFVRGSQSIRGPNDCASSVTINRWDSSSAGTDTLPTGWTATQVGSHGGGSLVASQPTILTLPTAFSG